MDEDAIRERVRGILIDQQAVEQELNLGFVAALIRVAYGYGYTAALSDPDPDFEETATATAAAYCRLPV